MKPGTGAGRIEDHARTALEEPFQLLDGALDDAQRDDREPGRCVLGS